MFCPACRAEYRKGFTQCNDCGVDLVPSLTANASLLRVVAGSSDESLVRLWSGVDPRFFSALKEALEEAGIEYDEHPTVPQLLSAARTDTFQIRIRDADLQAAKRVLADLGEIEQDAGDGTGLDSRPRDPLRVDPFGFSRPVIRHLAGNAPGNENPESRSDAEDVPADFVERFDPTEATVRIWTGADLQMAQIFEECLSNVGIGCVVDTHLGKTQVLVTRAAEKRAREVVREIEEGTPME